MKEDKDISLKSTLSTMSVQYPLRFPPFLFFSYLFIQQSTLLSSALAYPFSIANSLILASYTRVESG